MDQIHLTYLILATALGLFMAWGIGANDVANAMATSVGSKVLTIKKAIIIAAIFEFCGAVLAGGEVTSTIRKGIIDIDLFMGSPELVVYGMLASLLAAGIWLLVASKMGWPVSTTHSIVGSIVGFAIAAVGFEAVKWDKVGIIALTWVISPMIAGTLSFFLFATVQKLILNTKNPLDSAKKYAPFYVFLTGFLVALVTLFKGLKHLDIHLATYMNYIVAVIFGIILALISKALIAKIKIDPDAEKKSYFANVEKVFAIPMIFTACAMAFAHGSNDVANAIGPVSAIITYVTTGALTAKSSIPIWVLLLGGVGIVSGLAMLGYKVISTVGKNITELTPSRGFTCELAAAATIVIASGTGIPISTTHTLVGAVLGIGVARGISALNLNVVLIIFLSWLVTLPAGGILSIFFFYFFKGIFM